MYIFLFKTFVCCFPPNLGSLRQSIIKTLKPHLKCSTYCDNSHSSYFPCNGIFNSLKFGKNPAVDFFSHQVQIQISAPLTPCWKKFSSNFRELKTSTRGKLLLQKWSRRHTHHIFVSETGPLKIKRVLGRFLWD